MPKAEFIPTPEQSALIEEAERHFAESQRSGRLVTRYFIEKCSSEEGIGSQPRGIPVLTAEEEKFLKGVGSGAFGLQQAVDNHKEGKSDDSD